MDALATAVLAQGAAPPVPAAPPETHLLGYPIPLPPWAVILILAGAGAVFHWGLRSVLHRWAKRTSTDLDDILLGVTGWAVPVWILLLIVYVALEMDQGRHPRLHELVTTLVVIGFLVSLFWALSSLLLKSLARWAAKNEQYRPIYPPIRFVLKAVLIVVAGVTILAFLEVNISALLATLGVGGLAVALALRDTLENFFAGLHIMADRPIMEGDRVLVHETGDRGVVLKVGWRSTRIQTVDNNVLVVPNIKLSSGTVTNLSAVDPRVFVRVQVGVSYDADPDRVAAVLEDVARAAAGEVRGMAADPAPVAWLHPGFGPSSLDFTLRVTLADPDSGFSVQDALRRRILRRFRSEGIEIPYPITTVDLRRRDGGAGPGTA